jgi:hypothetical protein
VWQQKATYQSQEKHIHFKRKIKDFSNANHCSRNVIRCERRSTQCTPTSQFGDPKTEQRRKTEENKEAGV